MSNQSPRVFISYRRSDRAMAAHWVHREVAAKFGKDKVFFDVDGIPAGFDYRDFLQEQVSRCDVLLAVIGDDWLDVRDAEGGRRLDQANDFVRIEIEAALQRKIPVIPVLVENARMPTARELPTGLHELAYRQAREVRSGHHLDDHFRRLNESIEQAWRIHLERLQQPTVASDQGRSAVGTPVLGLKLASIPAGTFKMGSPDDESERRDNEGPQHEVNLTQGFYLGVYPVTQDEYQQVVGSNPSSFTGNAKRPVEQVSWFDAVAFCNRLSDREQLSPFYKIDGERVRSASGNGYRLPTEAEWEYACRAGTTKRWSFGDDESRLGEFAWYDGNSGSATHPVGEKPANAWGLHDMHGNVWEWCWDWFGDYTADPQTEPKGPESGAGRVLRGGSWDGLPRDCRSAIRGDSQPDDRNHDFGFRVART